VLSLGGREIFEVKLGEAFLMSSLFHEVEVALANQALAQLRGEDWDILVGGLGLGYTALAALQNSAVRSVVVIEALRPVIEWHEKGMVPLGAKLVGDHRCRFLQGNFFELVQGRDGFDKSQPGCKYHALLLDIDHSPANLLHPSHGQFYQPNGLQELRRFLHDDGIFAQWSDDAPDTSFLCVLESVFGKAHANVVRFANPLLECESSSTIYLAGRCLAAD
jgi:spermidine synthase